MRRVSVISVICYSQNQKTGKPNNLKVFGGKEVKRSKQYSQYWLRLHMPEGEINLSWWNTEIEAKLSKVRQTLSHKIVHSISCQLLVGFQVTMLLKTYTKHTPRRCKSNYNLILAPVISRLVLDKRNKYI